jgi:hypothetical protein
MNLGVRQLRTKKVKPLTFFVIPQPLPLWYLISVVSTLVIMIPLDSEFALFLPLVAL